LRSTASSMASTVPNVSRRLLPLDLLLRVLSLLAANSGHSPEEAHKAQDSSVGSPPCSRLRGEIPGFLTADFPARLRRNRSVVQEHQPRVREAFPNRFARGQPRMNRWTRTSWARRSRGCQPRTILWARRPTCPPSRPPKARRRRKAIPIAADMNRRPRRSMRSRCDRGKSSREDAIPGYSSTEPAAVQRSCFSRNA
jgi:hypothetical protein